MSAMHDEHGVPTAGFYLGEAYHGPDRPQEFYMSEKVMSIGPVEDSPGMVCFREQCDGYYRLICSKEQAIAGLMAAIEYIKNLPE